MPALLAYAAVADSAAAFVKTLVSAAAAVTVQIGTKATPSLRLPLCSVINTAFHLPVTNTFCTFKKNVSKPSVNGLHQSQNPRQLAHLRHVPLSFKTLPLLEHRIDGQGSKKTHKP
jgi:hypothetical protein